MSTVVDVDYLLQLAQDRREAETAASLANPPRHAAQGTARRALYRGRHRTEATR